MPHPKNQKNYQINLSLIAFCFFILSRIFAITLSFPNISDVFYYLEVFDKISLLNQIPYKDFLFEYPPLTLPIIYLSGIFSPIDNGQSYFIFFISIIFLADFFCLKISQSYCKKLKMSDHEIAYMTILYSLFGLLLFKLIHHRLDIFIALFFTSSLMLFNSKSKNLKPTFFANAICGFFYKIIPILNAPIAILFKGFQEKSVKESIIKIIKDSSIFAAIIIFLILSLELITNHNFIKSMLYHQERGIQIESSFASIVILKSWIFGQEIFIYQGYGAWNIKASQAFTSISKIFGSLILLSFYLIIFLKLLQKKIKNQKIEITDQSFFEATLITILIFISFQRVLSTQFLIWIIPFAAILIAKNNSIKLLLAFSMIFLATFAIFSIDYFAILNQEPILLTILILRNLFLMAFTTILAINYLKKLND